MKNLEIVVESIYKNKKISFEKKFLMFANNVIFYDLTKSEMELLSEIEDSKFIYGVSNPLDDKLRDVDSYSISVYLQEKKYNKKFELLNSVIDDFCENNDISDEEINLYVYYDNLTKSEQNNIKGNLLSETKYIVKIFFVSLFDVFKTYQNLISKEQYVDNFSFEIDDKNNFLLSPKGKINSIVVNIASTSIKKIYESKGKNNGPLYNLNLRYYVKNKKIDEEINKTIDFDKDLFWFLNNGIVILCENFEISHNTNFITLKNFSFVNGGQTTHIIGNKENLPKFFIMCKIIQLPSMYFGFDKNFFVEKISVASNSQKPIKEKDLISNSYEVNNLSDRMFNHKPSLFLQKKRGQVIPCYLKQNYSELEKFTLDDVFQIVTSFNFQLPGITKSNKSKLWTIYKERIFSDIDLDQLYVCNILKKEIEKIVKKVKIRNKNTYNKMVEIYKTGSLFIFSSINFLWKFLVSKEELSKLFSNLDNQKNFDNFSIEFSKINAKKIKFLNISFFNSSFSVNVEDLVSIIVKNLFDFFEITKHKEGNIEFSNFSKLDKNYIDFLNYFYTLIINDDLLKKISIT